MILARTMKVTVLSLALAALLVSCGGPGGGSAEHEGHGPAGQDTGPMEPPRVLGFVEVTVEGNQLASASFKPLPTGAGGVGAQANLTLSALALKSRFVSLIDDSSTTAPTRYLSASFELTNNTGIALRNLNFYARAGAGSIGGTAFQGLYKQDGSSISDVALARSIMPAHGMELIGLSARPKPGQADFQAYGFEEVQAVQDALPAGSGTVLDYGYTARDAAGTGRAIPVGGSGQFTLGLRYQRQGRAADNPLTLRIDLVVTEDARPRVTRSAEESTADAVARANALGSTTNKAELVLIGSDADAPTGSKFDTVRLADVRTGTSSTYLSPATVTGGRWSSVRPWPVVSINATVLPDGKLITWSRHDLATQMEDGMGEAVDLYDPITRTHTPKNTSGPGTDVFCAGQTLLPDGRLLVIGGHLDGDKGVKNANIFDYRTGAWSTATPMKKARWYPTATVLPSGDVLATGGSDETGVNAQGDYSYTLLPEVRRADGSWRVLSGASRNTAWYPFMHVAPNGKVFAAGLDPDMAYLDTSGNGRWIEAGHRDDLYRFYGSSVMYDEGKVLVVGGAGDDADGTILPTNTAVVMGLSATSDTVTVTPTGSMRYGRRQHTAVALPDGQVLVVGGTSAKGHNDARGSVLIPELWNPGTGQWSELNPMKERRLYHSTALLLPDGRVFVGGGGRPASAFGGDSDHFTAEFYEPPYLFRGPRPTITGVPANLDYNASFAVDTPDKDAIGRVVLARLPSVTHAFDENQRLVPLTFTKSASGLSVTAPRNANLAPPGQYMLFILSADGVPSKAKIITVD